MGFGDVVSGDVRETWGIADYTALWPVTVRILIVIDGRIGLNTGAHFPFGLGYVLDTLRAQFSWWVHLEVDVARRKEKQPLLPEQVESRELKYLNFKFTNAGFSIDSYDQVWFFGDQPSDLDGADGVTTDDDIESSIAALDPDELKLVADWMARGGGVFAAGDHSILGASMCSRIPRVRSMRKWKHSQGVPPRDGDGLRHETLQPSASEGADKEGDKVLQPIELVYRRVGWPLPGPLMPHPLLDSTLGLIDRFPDHMHEGEVIPDDDVQLDRPLDFVGHDRPEYPYMTPGFLASGPLDVAEVLGRPRPHVIAYGRTTNRIEPEATIQLALAPGFKCPGPSRFAKRFGLVSVYDGDPVGLGRVVVDSTWHHWFSLNLVGIAKPSGKRHTIAYRKMQSYYRNVALWLAKPSQRQSMLAAGTWGVLAGSAVLNFGMNDSPWEIGERVLEKLGLTASPSMLGEFAASFLDPKTFVSTGLPDDLVSHALVGSVSTALLDHALDYRQKRRQGLRPRFDPEAISGGVVKGVSRAKALLRKSVDDAASAIIAVRDALAADAGPIDVHIPIDVRRLRVVVEMLQFPDPSDPVLIGREVTLTIRIRVGDFVVAHRVFECMQLPAFDARGSVMKLACDMADVEVRTGESLSIEVLAGCEMPGVGSSSDSVRFSEILHGDATEWVGRCAVPARSQPWRLWYRVEETAPTPGQNAVSSSSAYE
jgi:hypothetical protein